MNYTQEEKIKLEVYKEFYEDNKELLKRDAQEYAYKQRIYVEKQFEKIKYNLK